MATRLHPDPQLGVVDEEHLLTVGMDDEPAGCEVAWFILGAIKWVVSGRSQVEHLDPVPLLGLIAGVVAGEEPEEFRTGRRHAATRNSQLAIRRNTRHDAQS